MSSSINWEVGFNAHLVKNYEVFRSTDIGTVYTPENKITEVGPTVRSYNDPALFPGAPVYYYGIVTNYKDGTRNATKPRIMRIPRYMGHGPTSVLIGDYEWGLMDVNFTNSTRSKATLKVVYQGRVHYVHGSPSAIFANNTTAFMQDQMARVQGTTQYDTGVWKYESRVGVVTDFDGALSIQVAATGNKHSVNGGLWPWPGSGYTGVTGGWTASIALAGARASNNLYTGNAQSNVSSSATTSVAVSVTEVVGYADV